VTTCDDDRDREHPDEFGDGEGNRRRRTTRLRPTRMVTQGFVLRSSFIKVDDREPTGIARFTAELGDRILLFHSANQQ
jgi:hypothetical protein